MLSLTCIWFLSHTWYLKNGGERVFNLINKVCFPCQPKKWDVAVLCFSPPAPALTSGVRVRSPGACRWSQALSEPREQPGLRQRHGCRHLALRLVNSWMRLGQFAAWPCRHMLYHDACLHAGELKLHSIYECVRIHMCAAVQSKAYASVR